MKTGNRLRQKDFRHRAPDGLANARWRGRISLRLKQAIGVESRFADLALAYKPIYGDQTLANGIDCEEKTFKSHGAEQRRTIGRNKTLSSDFIAVQSQPCFGYGPDVSLSASDHDALRTHGLQLKPFRQRSGHHAKSSAGVHKKLNFFDTSRRAGQMSLYVKQSHLKYHLSNMVIVAQSISNATTLISLKKA